MKKVFSTRYVDRKSFLDVCCIAHDYGFSGFEIYDAENERRFHRDSILRSDNLADAKRKLNNRSLSISALSYPNAIDSKNTTATSLLQYVDMASISGISTIIVNFSDIANLSDIKDADCIIFAVAHNEFKEMTLEEIDKLYKNLPNEEKVFIDVKGMFDPVILEQKGYTFWRL